MTVVETVTIRAPRERVFDYRLDVTTLPEYNPDVSRVESLGDSSYRFRVRLAPGFSARAKLTVVETDRPNRLVFEIASLMNAREECTFETDGDATRIRFEISVKIPGGVFGKPLGRLFVVPTARRQLRKELELMKQRLES